MPFAIEDAEFDSAGRDRFDAVHVDAAIGAQNPRQVRNPCSGCGRLASAAAIKASVLGPIFSGPAAQPVRRPLGVTPVGTGHVLGLRAVLSAHVAALMDRDALAAMEHFDHARGDANLDLRRE